ncbi:DinB family protein [Halalkalibaculum sp. DA3122]|uniref:DinB family protein n=1 Tax=unclassified Halalkalibaculum TaxID=2964617 RepID=UPI003754A338
MKSEEIGSIVKTWKTNRQRYLNAWEEHSLERLNTIPQGFNNNLIWSFGHIIVSQQALIYRLSGLEGYVSDQLFVRHHIRYAW